MGSVMSDKLYFSSVDKLKLSDRLDKKLEVATVPEQRPLPKFRTEW